MSTPEQKTETLERMCMMCEEVCRVIAKVGPLDIKEPCPCKCGPGYFEPPGRTIRKFAGKEGNNDLSR